MLFGHCPCRGPAPLYLVGGGAVLTGAPGLSAQAQLAMYRAEQCETGNAVNRVKYKRKEAFTNPNGISLQFAQRTQH